MNGKRKKVFAVTLPVCYGQCWWIILVTVTCLVIVISCASGKQLLNNDCDNCPGGNDGGGSTGDGIQQSTFVSNLKHLFEEKIADDEDDLKIWSAVDHSLHTWEQNKKHRLGNDTNKRRIKRDEATVCYPNFGCFRDEGPFDYLDTLPASPESIGTTFMLYTRQNPTEGQLIDYDNQTTLFKSNFNASNDVKIIIHGFGSSSRRPWVLQMTEALLYLDDFNVINVDWENGSRMPNYVQAAANTQLIGKQIAKLIRMINYVTSLTPSRYHLIGFSLGAHVAGFTGMEIQNISRITGLDPASPLFEGYPARVRLDPTDASFVDVIHSNGDSFIRGGLGSYAPMGHVDFYPNGGRVQVGCNSVLMGAITDIIYGKWNSLCNHRRAFRFFIDSVVRTCTFRAFACSSYEEYVKGNCFSCGEDNTQCSNMGYFAYGSKGRGNMYLVTRDKEPFCVNQFRIRIESSSNGQGVTWGRIEIQLLNYNGLNETFSLTQETGELKEAGVIQALIVAHPEITNVTEMTLTYTRYKGWIYNGQSDWFIDRIELLDSNGNINSYCLQNTKLSNTVMLRLALQPGNCTISTHKENSISIGNPIRQPNTVSSTVTVPDVHPYPSLTPSVQFYPYQQTNFYPQYQSTPFSPNTASTVYAVLKPLSDTEIASPGSPPNDDNGVLNLLNNEIESTTPTQQPSYSNVASNYFWQILSNIQNQKSVQNSQLTGANYTDEDKIRDENHLAKQSINVPLFEEVDGLKVNTNSKNNSPQLETTTDKESGRDSGEQLNYLARNGRKRESRQQKRWQEPSFHAASTAPASLSSSTTSAIVSSPAIYGAVSAPIHHRIRAVSYHMGDVENKQHLRQQQLQNNTPNNGARQTEHVGNSQPTVNGRGNGRLNNNPIVVNNENGENNPTEEMMSSNIDTEQTDNGNLVTRRKVSSYLLNKTTQFLWRLMFANVTPYQTNQSRPNTYQEPYVQQAYMLDSHTTVPTLSPVLMYHNSNFFVLGNSNGGLYETAPGITNRPAYSSWATSSTDE